MMKHTISAFPAIYISHDLHHLSSIPRKVPIWSCIAYIEEIHYLITSSGIPINSLNCARKTPMIAAVSGEYSFGSGTDEL